MEQVSTPNSSDAKTLISPYLSKLAIPLHRSNQESVENFTTVKVEYFLLSFSIIVHLVSLITLCFQPVSTWWIPSITRTWWLTLDAYNFVSFNHYIQRGPSVTGLH